MNIVLIGMKHCGKSVLGSKLAEHWGYPFYDIDAMIDEFKLERLDDYLARSLAHRLEPGKMAPAE